MVIARAVSAFGAWGQVAVAAWYVLAQTGSATMVGVLAACSYGPSMVGSPIGGWLAHRFPLRRLCVVLNLLEALPVFATFVLLLIGPLDIPMLLLLVFLAAVPNALLGPAQSMMPLAAAPARDRPKVVADNSLGYSIAKMAGPVVGSLLTAAWGPAWVFLLNGGSFLWCAAVVATAKLPYLSDVIAEKKSSQIGFARGVRLGMGLRIGQAAILGILVFVGLAAPIEQLMPTVAASHGDAPTQVGILLAALAAGTVCVNVVLRRLIARGVAAGRLISGGLVIAAVAMGLLSLSSLIGTDMLLLFALGVSWGPVWVGSQSAIQLHLSPRVRGHMLGLFYSVVSLGTAVGAVIVGLAIDHVGVRAALLLTSLLLLAAGVIGWLFRRLAPAAGARPSDD